MLEAALLPRLVGVATAHPIVLFLVIPYRFV
jgi:hypothetical protein